MKLCKMLPCPIPEKWKPFVPLASVAFVASVIILGDAAVPPLVYVKVIMPYGSILFCVLRIITLVPFAAVIELMTGLTAPRSVKSEPVALMLPTDSDILICIFFDSIFFADTTVGLIWSSAWSDPSATGFNAEWFLPSCKFPPSYATDNDESVGITWWVNMITLENGIIVDPPVVVVVIFRTPTALPP